MRIGIVSDIHCNIAGLKLALEHMDSVDEVICAGDSIYQFRFSNEVVGLLRSVGARVILSNHEEIFLSPHGERARQDPRADQSLLRWLSEQPRQTETTIGNKRILVALGSPWEPYDEYIYPNSASLTRLREVDSDYIILGHTHYQMAKWIDGRLAINPGSAGEPRDQRNSLQLSCAILDTGTSEVRFIQYPNPADSEAGQIPPHLVVPASRAG